MALPFRGAATATKETASDIKPERPAQVGLTFSANGRRDSTPTAPLGEPPMIPEVTESEPSIQASTFENGGWRPRDDGRDNAGRSFAEWVEACHAIEMDKEPAPPRQPRFKGLFPDGPRVQPIAESPDATKTVTANGKAVSRLDAYARKPSRATRARKKAEKGASYVRAKDIFVTETIHSFGMVTRDQLAGLMNITPNSLVRRLGKLTEMGILTKGRSIGGLNLYSVTPAGRRLIGAEGWANAHQSLLRYDHTQACIEVAIWLQRLNPNAVVISERELLHATFDADGKVASGGDIGPRLLRIAPWLAEQSGNDFSLWTPRIHGPFGGTVGHKRPDLLLARQGMPPVVIEVELQAKTKASGGYGEMIAAYSEAQAEGHISQVIYLVSEDAALSATRLNTLLDRARAGAAPSMGKKGDITVRVIPPDVWQPLAVRLRG